MPRLILVLPVFTGPTNLTTCPSILLNLRELGTLSANIFSKTKNNIKTCVLKNGCALYI